MACKQCGKKGCKGHPMKGFYGGTSYATGLTPAEEQQQQEMQMQRLQAPLMQNAPQMTQEPTSEEVAGQVASGYAMNKGVDTTVNAMGGQTGQLTNSITDIISGNPMGTAAGDATFEAIVGPGGGVNATDAVLNQANTAAADAAVAGAGGEMLGSALGGFGGAAVSDLMTKGEVDEKTLLKGGLAMGANMIVPGSGFIVGPALTAMGLQDGTENLQRPQLMKPEGLPMEQSMDPEEMAKAGLMGIVPYLIAKQHFQDGTSNVTKKGSPLSDYKKTSTGAVADADYSRRIQAINEYRQGIPNYQQLPGGGMADMNASIYFEEMRKQAQRENAKRIKDAMGEQ